MQEEFVNMAQHDGFFAQMKSSIDTWGRINHYGKWLVNLNKCNNMTVGEFWKSLFGVSHPQNARGLYGAVFSVSRSRILSRPKRFYENAIKLVDHHQNPEEGHYFERFWPSIFRCTRK